MVQVGDVSPSMDLEFTSSSGEVSVYNLGDIAWGECGSLTGLGRH
jgi:hypothetical protein